MDVVEQFSIYWVELDPTRGGEMNKTHPCVVISPEELNAHLSTVIIAPVTSTIREYPYRVHCFIMERDGEIATDQLRVIDKGRLKEEIGRLDEEEISNLRSVLNQMFCL